MINNLKKVTKEYVLTLLNKGDEYIVFNPLTNTYHTEIVGKNDIAHNKHAYDKLIYYIEVKK
jgi:hypothetical protein